MTLPSQENSNGFRKLTTRISKKLVANRRTNWGKKYKVKKRPNLPKSHITANDKERMISSPAKSKVNKSFLVERDQSMGTLKRKFTLFQTKKEETKGTVGSVYAQWHKNNGKPVETKDVQFDKKKKEALKRHMNSSFGVTISKFAIHVIEAYNKTAETQLTKDTVNNQEFDVEFIKKEMTSFIAKEINGLRPRYKEDCKKALTDFLEYCCGIRKCDQKEEQKTTKVTFNAIWDKFLNAKVTLGSRVKSEEQPEEARAYKEKAFERMTCEVYETTKEQDISEKTESSDSVDSDMTESSPGILAVTITSKHLEHYKPFTTQPIDPNGLSSIILTSSNITNTGIEHLTGAFADYCIATGNIKDGKIPVNTIEDHIEGFIKANQGQLDGCQKHAEQLLKNVIAVTKEMVKKDTQKEPTHLTKEQLLAGAGCIQAEANKALFQAKAPKDYTEQDIKALKKNPALNDPNATETLIKSDAIGVHGNNPDVLGDFFETIFAKIAQITTSDPEVDPFTFKTFKEAVDTVAQENTQFAQFKDKANRAVFAYMKTQNVDDNQTFTAPQIRLGVAKMNAFNNQLLANGVVKDYLVTARTTVAKNYASVQPTKDTSTSIYKLVDQFASAYLQEGLPYFAVQTKIADFVEELGIVENKEQTIEVLLHVLDVAYLGRGQIPLPWVTGKNMRVAAQKVETARQNPEGLLATTTRRSNIISDFVSTRQNGEKLKKQIEQLASLEKKVDQDPALYDYDDETGMFNTIETPKFNFGTQVQYSTLDSGHPLVVVVNELLQTKWGELEQLKTVEGQYEQNDVKMKERHKIIAGVVQQKFGQKLDKEQQHALIAAVQCAIYSGDGYDNPLVKLENQGKGKQLIWGNVAAVIKKAETHSKITIANGSTLPQEPRNVPKSPMLTRFLSIKSLNGGSNSSSSSTSRSKVSTLGNVELYEIKEKRLKEGICPNLKIFEGVVNPIYEHYRYMRNIIGGQNIVEIQVKDVHELFVTADLFFKALRFWHPTTKMFNDTNWAKSEGIKISEFLTGNGFQMGSHHAIKYTCQNKEMKNQFFHKGQDWGACPNIKATAKINSHRNSKDSFELGMMMTIWGDILYLMHELKIKKNTIFDTNGMAIQPTETSITISEIWGSLRGYLLDHSSLAGQNVKWDVFWYFMKEFGVTLPKKLDKFAQFIGSYTYFTKGGFEYSKNVVSKQKETFLITDLKTFEPEFDKLTPSDRKRTWKKYAK